MNAFSRMDPSIRKRWIAALRGGLYEQGWGQLRDANDKCCCLGVLCDQIEPRKWKQFVGSWLHRGSNGIISKRFARELGLTPREIKQLVFMNDDGGQTFEQIADVIESGKFL
jgi:hypothetical protein